MIRLFDTFSTCDIGGRAVVLAPRGQWFKGLNCGVNIELRSEDGLRTIASFLKPLGEPVGGWIRHFQIDLRTREIEGQRWEVWAAPEGVEVQDCSLATEFALGLRPGRSASHRFRWSEVLPRGFTAVEIYPCFESLAALVLSGDEEPSWGTILVERTPVDALKPLEQLPFEVRGCELRRALSLPFLAEKSDATHVTDDGIGFDVWRENADCSAHIRFRHPCVGPLREISIAVMRTCREIAKQTKRESVRAWVARFERTEL